MPIYILMLLGAFVRSASHPLLIVLVQERLSHCTWESFVVLDKQASTPQSDYTVVLLHLGILVSLRIDCGWYFCCWVNGSVPAIIISVKSNCLYCGPSIDREDCALVRA
jgi:hypothetical protein